MIARLAPVALLLAGCATFGTPAVEGPVSTVVTTPPPATSRGSWAETEPSPAQTEGQLPFGPRSDAEIETDRQALAEQAAAEEAESQAESERYRQISDRRLYDAAIAAGTGEGCPPWEEILGHQIVLMEYVGATERTSALQGLERCRREFVADVRTRMPGLLKTQRRDFALEIEDGFDAANPYAKGTLVAKPDGSVLRVKMKGGFGGRARHTEAEVESWCTMDNARVFAKIVLTNVHGTFACEPPEWPGGARQFTDLALRNLGADVPISTDPGTRPTPPPVVD